MVVVEMAGLMFVVSLVGGEVAGGSENCFERLKEFNVHGKCPQGFVVRLGRMTFSCCGTC